MNYWLLKAEQRKDFGDADSEEPTYREPENGRELLKKQYYDFVAAKREGKTPKSTLEYSKSMGCMINRVVGVDSSPSSMPTGWQFSGMTVSSGKN